MKKKPINEGVTRGHLKGGVEKRGIKKPPSSQNVKPSGPPPAPTPKKK
jgi:hypothetical protein